MDEAQPKIGAEVQQEIVSETAPRIDPEFYCPRCGSAVSDPLACGDCAAIICRRCGGVLERIDELGIG